jgi:hypothetical protein
MTHNDEYMLLTMNKACSVAFSKTVQCRYHQRICSLLPP